jgi:acylphosphatase
MTTARRVLVEGRVQGVGFRAFVRATGADLGLAGWVRNLSDGGAGRAPPSGEWSGSRRRTPPRRGTRASRSCGLPADASLRTRAADAPTSRAVPAPARELVKPR